MAAEVAQKPWQVWRQDDNGNRFLVESYMTRELAEARIEELTRTIHKQIYWICELDIDKV